MRLFLLFSLSILTQIDALKILGIFPHPGSSHFIVFQPLLVELTKRGHRVTVISHFPLNDPVGDYYDISLRGTIPIWKSVFTFDQFTYFTPVEKFTRHLGNARILTQMGYNACVAMMENKQVHSLQRGHFDLALVEDFNSDCAMGLVHKLKLPFVGLTSNAMMVWSYDNLGLVSNPAFVSLHFLGSGSRPNFLQRVESVLLQQFYLWYYYLHSQIPERELLKRYVGDDLPPLEAIVRNMSLLLTNTYFPFTGSKHLPPSVVEVGGIYHESVKELPKELKDYLDDAKEGVIVFSMGSMLNASSLPEQKLKSFQDAFSKLNQKVLMKWEEDAMPGVPSNVKIMKWLPQYDVLHHVNVVGFVTHAGMLGTSEAVKAGVPVLAIPMYGDQFHNAACSEENDAGVTINYKNITFESISWGLNELLSPRLQNGAKRLSLAWNDRPLSAMDTAIYWIEYVARHGGRHLHPSSSDLSLHKYLLLDVIAFLLSIIMIVLYVASKCFHCVRKTFRGKPKRD